MTETNAMPFGLSPFQRTQKRVFDLVASLFGLILLFPFIAVAWAASTLSTRKNGLFVQYRIGLHGKRFPLLKIRTMKDMDELESTVTTESDPRITPIGRVLRKTKLDELPQLINVVLGHMSLVGPRPDVSGFADKLVGDDRIILTVRPGITGPATLHFRDEEQLLDEQSDPENYNREIVWPKKIEINREYIQNWNLTKDIMLIFKTLLG